MRQGQPDVNLVCGFCLNPGLKLVRGWFTFKLWSEAAMRWLLFKPWSGLVWRCRLHYLGEPPQIAGDGDRKVFLDLTSLL